MNMFFNAQALLRSSDFCGYTETVRTWKYTMGSWKYTSVGSHVQGQVALSFRLRGVEFRRRFFTAVQCRYIYAIHDLTSHRL